MRTGKGILDMKVGETMLFYPQFCLDCMERNISRTEANPCPFCGSENVVNHKREIYKDRVKG